MQAQEERNKTKPGVPRYPRPNIQLITQYPLSFGVTRRPFSERWRVRAQIRANMKTLHFRGPLSLVPKRGPKIFAVPGIESKTTPGRRVIDLYWGGRVRLGTTSGSFGQEVLSGCCCHRRGILLSSLGCAVTAAFSSPLPPITIIHHHPSLTPPSRTETTQCPATKQHHKDPNKHVGFWWFIVFILFLYERGEFIYQLYLLCCAVNLFPSPSPFIPFPRSHRATTVQSPPQPHPPNLIFQFLK